MKKDRIKEISWESWNAREEEMIFKSMSEEKDIINKLNESTSYASENQQDEFISVSTPVISTPFGEYASNSIFKPSDRWSCWTGHTNFPIDEEVFDILNDQIEGIEALAILGAYTFCIGIAKLFSPGEVKLDIGDRLLN